MSSRCVDTVAVCLRANALFLVYKPFKKGRVYEISFLQIVVVIQGAAFISQQLPLDCRSVEWHTFFLGPHNSDRRNPQNVCYLIYIETAGQVESISYQGFSHLYRCLYHLVVKGRRNRQDFFFARKQRVCASL